LFSTWELYKNGLPFLNNTTEEGKILPIKQKGECEKQPNKSKKHIIENDDGYVPFCGLFILMFKFYKFAVLHKISQAVKK
jgi:hypothetical protein